MLGLELHVRSDADVLTFHIRDRDRGATSAPCGIATLGRSHTMSRAERLRTRIAAACAAGSFTRADHEAVLGQSQLLHDLIVPAALRGVLRGVGGGALWLLLHGWSRQLPWEWLHDGEAHWFQQYALGRTEDARAIPTAPMARLTNFVFFDRESAPLAPAIEPVLSAALSGRVYGEAPLTSDLGVGLRAADLAHLACDADLRGLGCRDGWFGVDELARMDRPPALLVLSGSSTYALGRAAHRAGVPAVLATTTVTGPSTAARLDALYRDLLAGEAVGEATRRARQAAGVAGAPWILLGDPALLLHGPLRASAPVDGYVAVFHRLAAELSLGRAGVDLIWRAVVDRVAAMGLAVRDVDGAQVVECAVARFGDRAGEAALVAAESLLDVLGAPSAGVELGVGVGVAVGEGGEARARELAQRAQPGVILADGDARAASRRHRRVFIAMRRPASRGGPVWQAGPGSRPPNMPLLGRAAALQTLQASLGALVRTDRGGVVVIEGASGTGKTALVDAFVRTAIDRDVAVAFIERPETAPPEERFEDPGDARVAIYEDLHRAGDDAFGAALAAITGLRARPGLCVLTLRASTPALRARLRRLEVVADHVVRLGPLETSDASALARQLLGVPALSEEQQRAVQAAGGNPLLVRASALGPTSSGASALVRAMVAERLAEAGEEGSRVLEAAAVLGPRCTAESIEAVLSLSPRAVANAASDGWLSLRSEVVAGRRQARCSVRDPLLAQWLEALMDPARRARLHQAAFDWHRAQGSAAAVQARHGLRSLAPLRAVPALWAAVRRGRDAMGFLDALEALLATTPEGDLPPGAPTAAQLRAFRVGSAPLRAVGRVVPGALAGVGRLGTRFLAEGDGDVELRIPHPELIPGAEEGAALGRRLAALRALDHPALLAVRELAEVDGRLVLVTDAPGGLTGRAVLGVLDGGLPRDVALRVVADVADLLATLTRALPEAASALDLRPEGIWLDRSGRVRVEHLTVLQGHPIERLAEIGALRGRAGSLAPELLEGRLHRANSVWSLGTLLWELLVGQPLFPGRTIAEVSAAVRHRGLVDALTAEAIDPEVAALLRRVLVRAPERRALAEGVAAELEALTTRRDPDRLARPRIGELVEAVAAAASSSAAWT